MTFIHHFYRKIGGKYIIINYIRLFDHYDSYRKYVANSMYVSEYSNRICYYSYFYKINQLLQVKQKKNQK